ncbi:MAG TPA: hypothetical protein ENG83_14395 [Nitrospirae bacterium]|nr:GTPase Der [bacterium BMS3Abin06]HDH13363.1 hypothetical protein [Nitrospirota bacterium]HDZ00731.1 hypothetical protein [Nitrospirota bacterium]
MTMKETYSSLKEELLGINESLSSLLSTVQSRPDIADSRFHEWHKACKDIHHQISEEVVRVAVVGAVKSGKSTFVNSLFRGDYLKRGAGIVTSIVTRIRSGKNLKAVLFFKSWDEINADIEQALVMLPSWERQADDKPFDIRRERDRRSLRRALEGLSNDLLITDGVRNTNSILLSLYLKGYDLVNEMISAESMTTEFSGERFPEHRTYVGDDALAVYLKDIELEINDDTIDRSIEIADCQGSDSPNPLHLAMIQDYLLRTHLIVYVISSRTGLRQADIRFLSMIKKMGILENILFVVNIDLSEHESLEDLNKVVDKAREELALIRPDPDLYTFSALFNLFSVSSVNLTKRDSLRLDQWMAEKDVVAFSNNETERFETYLNSKLTRDRFDLLIKNHLARMEVMAAGAERWALMNKELMRKDVEGASSIIKKMKHHQERMEQIKSLVKNTLSGAKDKVMRELKAEIDKFFNIYSGSIVEQTSNFVRQYTISTEDYREKLTASGFSNTLYHVFQEFKQALDAFMTNTVNPEIARFSKGIEGRIQSSLESIAGPYQSLASDDIAELKAVINNSFSEINGFADDVQHLLDINIIKRVAGLSLPSSTAALRYSAKVRTGAVMRLGFYSLKKFIKKAFKKTPEQEKEEQMLALADGFMLIKRETEKAIVFHFENYRENFKFQYVSRLLNAAVEYLHQLLIERFQSYNADVKVLEMMMEKKGSEREDMIEFLDRVAMNAEDIQETINRAGKAIVQTA